MRRKINLVYILILLVISCNNKQTAEKEEGSKHVEITKEQFLSEKMAIGVPAKVIIEEKIHFTGKIVPMINGMVKINTPVEGMVKDIRVQTGDYINANEILFSIGGFVLIELQQQFATSAAKIKQLASSYNRAKALFNDSITTEREYLLAESEYKSELANYTSLKLKLQYIGLDISKIEKGEYSSAYNIKSLIDGQISQINVVSGQYVKQEDVIAEVINNNKIELEMYFYENDFSKIARGQNVVFCSMAEADYNAMAIITRIGTTLSAYSNTLKGYATINNDCISSFSVNQLVNGEVIVASDSAYAVPQSAVISIENKKYVVVIVNESKNGYQIQKEEVKIGKTDKNYVELLDFPNDKTILLDGLQNIVFE